MGIWTDIAWGIAEQAHAGQKDLAGQPYFMHPRRVAQDVRIRSNGYDFLEAIALLHDVLEDTAVTEEQLIDAGLPMDLVDTVRVLTRVKGEDYDDYIARVALNQYALVVKLADLRDNMDITRLKSLGPGSYQRLAKYHSAYKRLTALEAQ